MRLSDKEQAKQIEDKRIAREMINRNSVEERTSSKKQSPVSHTTPLKRSAPVRHSYIRHKVSWADEMKMRRKQREEMEQRKEEKRIERPRETIEKQAAKDVRGFEAIDRGRKDIPEANIIPEEITPRRSEINDRITALENVIISSQATQSSTRDYAPVESEIISAGSGDSATDWAFGVALSGMTASYKGGYVDILGTNSSTELTNGTVDLSSETAEKVWIVVEIIVSTFNISVTAHTSYPTQNATTVYIPLVRLKLNDDSSAYILDRPGAILHRGDIHLSAPFAYS